MQIADKDKNIFLIIGYGNDLRGDDAAGQIAAREIEKWNDPRIKTIDTHQLTPEIAYDLSLVKYAFFIDAYVSENEDFVKVNEIEPKDVDIITTGHFGSPEGTLQLSKSIYGINPRAWLIAIPGVYFEFSEELSKITQEGVKTAVSKIKEIIDSISL